jgi:hypothetical protein
MLAIGLDHIHQNYIKNVFHVNKNLEYLFSTFLYRNKDKYGDNSNSNTNIVGTKANLRVPCIQKYLLSISIIRSGSVGAIRLQVTKLRPVPFLGFSRSRCKNMSL